MANERPIIWDADNADHRRAFATAIAPAVSVLWKRAEPFSSADARIYMRTLKYVPSAILVEVIESALETEKWFPEPSRLLSIAAGLIAAKRKAASEKWLGSDCEECHSSRWITVDVDGVKREQRCGCWRRAMLELDAIGQPIARKHLGEGTETGA